MSNYSQESTTNEADYNPDGSLTIKGRERFRSLLKLSESEIDRIESVNMRHVAVEKEQAYWKEQHKKDREEWRKKREAEKKEQERLGITPVVEVLYSSPDKIDVNDLNPSQVRSYEMSGLSTEELLSQGYIDLDDLTHSGEKSEDKNPPPYKADPNTPDIPF